MIFTTTEEFRDLISISSNMDFNSLLPDIKRAERTYLLPYLGQEQYDELIKKYEEGAEEEKWQRLIAYSKEVVACFTMHIYLPLSQITISDLGTNLHHTDTQVTAFQWQIDDLNENYFLKLGHAGIDTLLTMMDENKIDYPKWANSDNYLINKDAIINTYTDFNKHYYIQNSPTTYFALKNIMQKTELFDIVPVLGQAFYDRIISETKAGEISDEVKDLHRWLNPMVAHYTISRALKETSFAIDAKGAFTTNYRTGGSAQNNREKLQLTAAQLDKARVIAADGCSYAALLTKFLTANASADKYQEYYTDFILPAAEAAAAEEEVVSGPFTIYGDGRDTGDVEKKERKFKGW
jgi:hypothetical protein